MVATQQPQDDHRGLTVIDAGNVFFEYIGTGETGAPDTVNTQATINKITTPSNAKGSFYWILFALTDQIANFQGMGQQTTTSSGNWVPTGVFDAGGNYSSTQIGYLKAKGKVSSQVQPPCTRKCMYVCFNICCKVCLLGIDSARKTRLASSCADRC